MHQLQRTGSNFRAGRKRRAADGRDRYFDRSHQLRGNTPIAGQSRSASLVETNKAGGRVRAARASCANARRTRRSWSLAFSPSQFRACGEFEFAFRLLTLNRVKSVCGRRRLALQGAASVARRGKGASSTKPIGVDRNTGLAGKDGQGGAGTTPLSPTMETSMLTRDFCRTELSRTNATGMESYDGLATVFKATEGSVLHVWCLYKTTARKNLRNLDPSRQNPVERPDNLKRDCCSLSLFRD